jgi:hypothetical protein
VGQTIAKSNEVKCQGGQFRYENELINGIMVDIDIKLTIQAEKFRFLDDKTYATDSSRELPCPANQLGCQRPDETFIWDSPKDECPIAYIQTSSGILTSNQAGQNVFMSTDGSNVRLVIYETNTFCERFVHVTNFEHIYAYEIGLDSNGKAKQKFTREIRADELSLGKYVRARDDYLYNRVMDRIEDEFQYVNQANCDARMREIKLNFWLQHRDPSLTTWFLGNHTFATAAGEVLYTYLCREVTVRALELDQCYDALPVQMLHPSGVLGNATYLFLEPLTHRLTRSASVIPCSHLFLAKYRNAQDSWTMATPRIMEAIPPRIITAAQLQRQSFTREDLSKGGLYLDAQMDQLEHFLDYGRMSQGLLHQMNNQAGYVPPGQSYHPQDLFPDAKIPWTLGLYEHVIKFFHEWGTICAGFIGFYIIYKFFAGLCKWVFGFMTLHEAYGCSTKLCLYLPCLGLLLLKSNKPELVKQQKQKKEMKARYRREKEVEGHDYVPLTGFHHQHPPGENANDQLPPNYSSNRSTISLGYQFSPRVPLHSAIDNSDSIIIRNQKSPPNVPDRTSSERARILRTNSLHYPDLSNPNFTQSTVNLNPTGAHASGADQDLIANYPIASNDHQIETPTVPDTTKTTKNNGV